jgi:hypothetical protein
MARLRLLGRAQRYHRLAQRSAAHLPLLRFLARGPLLADALSLPAETAAGAARGTGLEARAAPLLAPTPAGRLLPPVPLVPLDNESTAPDAYPNAGGPEIVYTGARGTPSAEPDTTAEPPVPVGAQPEVSAPAVPATPARTVGPALPSTAADVAERPAAVRPAQSSGEAPRLGADALQALPRRGQSPVGPARPTERAAGPPPGVAGGGPPLRCGRTYRRFRRVAVAHRACLQWTNRRRPVALLQMTCVAPARRRFLARTNRRRLARARPRGRLLGSGPRRRFAPRKRRCPARGLRQRQE